MSKGNDKKNDLDLQPANCRTCAKRLKGPFKPTATTLHDGKRITTGIVRCECGQANACRVVARALLVLVALLVGIGAGTEATAMANADEVKVLAGWYESAAERLAGLVLKPDGKTVKAQAFNAQRSANLFNEIDGIVRDLTGRATRWSGTVIPDAALAGAFEGDRQVKQLVAGTSMTTRIADSPIDRDSVRLLAADTVGRAAAGDLTKAASAMGNQVKGVLRATRQMGLAEAEVNRILAGGVIEGKPVDAIRNLREALRAVHGETVPVPTKNGGVMNFDVGYYAKMVAVTKTREATVKGRHDRLRGQGIDLVAIVGKVSNNFCTSFLGMVFSLSGSHPKYPPLPGNVPPYHPNCSKGTRPFLEELAGEGQIAQAEGVEDAHKLIGMNPTEAQRAYKDLQLRQQVEDTYKASTKG